MTKANALYDAAHPVAVAVEPLRNDAMKAARDSMTAYLDKLSAKLAECGMDREIAAPFPKSGRMSRNDYLIAKARYDIVRQISKAAPSPSGFYHSHRPGTPDVGVFDDVGFARLVHRAGEEASFSYTMFICKLIKKIGDCASATLDGSHVWGYSVLTATLADGTVQRWKTQQILNVSVLGKLFNQWPSRIVK
jgi:hypothetical protein